MISPIIFRLGIFQVSYYALVYVFGFLALLFILLSASRKKEIDLKEEDVYDFIALFILGVIIGARLFHVLFWNFEFFSKNLVDILYVWRGGLSFHGGLVGGILVVVWFSRWKGINKWKMADLVIFPAILFLALGRIANLINQEIVGVVSDVKWCVNFEGHEGCRHPVQIYGAIGRFVLFMYLLILNDLKKFKEGFLFWNFVFFIGLGRFVVDFMREGDSYFGLLVGQWFSLLMVLIGGIILWKKYKKEIELIFSKQLI